MLFLGKNLLVLYLLTVHSDLLADQPARDPWPTFAQIPWNSTKQEVQETLLHRGYTTDRYAGQNQLAFRGEIFEKNAQLTFSFHHEELTSCEVSLDWLEETQADLLLRKIYKVLVQKYGRALPSNHQQFTWLSQSKDQFPCLCLSLKSGGSRHDHRVIVVYRSPKWIEKSTLEKKQKAEANQKSEQDF